MVRSLVGLRLRPGGAYAPRGLGAGERAASPAHQRRDDARRKRSRSHPNNGGSEWVLMGFYDVCNGILWCFNGVNGISMVFYGVLWCFNSVLMRFNGVLMEFNGI